MRHANVWVYKGMKWRSLSHLFILTPLSIAQVAASWKSSDVLLLSMRPCLLWIRISGVPLSRWQPSSSCVMHVFCQYSSMDLRYGLYSVTSSLSKKIDMLDNWCLRRIHIHWTDFVSDDEVRSRTGQPFLFDSDTIRRRRLSFFGHLSRADPSQNYSRALQSCILGPPRDWHCRVGRPRQSWLRTVEDDLRPLNFGLATARRCILDRSAWRLLVETATSTWHVPEREREYRISVEKRRIESFFILLLVSHQSQ